MKIDYTNLSFTQLIDKIEANRFFDLPRMVREAFRRLLTRVEALEDAPTPSESFIPLSGTEVGSPVTGDIEISELVKIKNGNRFIRFTDELSVEIGSINETEYGYSGYVDGTINNYVGTEAQIASLQTNIGTTAYSSTNPIARGFSGLQDFTSNIQDLDYTQKKYVDERGSVFNATTSVLSASDLNTAYPNAKDGFSVIAPNVVGGGKYYIKAGAGWVYQQILAVV